MRIAKTVTLLVLLLFVGLVLELTFPKKVHAADDVRETTWLDAEKTIGCLFSKDDEVYCTWSDPDPLGDDLLKKGKYRQDGRSVEITFEDYYRISATITGNKMSVRETNNKGKFVGDYVLIKKK